MHVLVVAKEPRPGHVKTRLCPPFTPDEAAALSEAALADTLHAATSSGAERVVVALDGRAGEWCPRGVEIVAQCGGGLDQRLAHAWRHAGGPGVQIGMDTPQVSARHLDDAMATLADGVHDATLGPASDGGWWLIGLSRPDDRVFLGIPMSTPTTGEHQRARLRALGLHYGTEPTLRDVDRHDDAAEVARLAPESCFGRLHREITATWPARPGSMS